MAQPQEDWENLGTQAPEKKETPKFNANAKAFNPKAKSFTPKFLQKKEEPKTEAPKEEVKEEKKPVEAAKKEAAPAEEKVEEKKAEVKPKEKKEETKAEEKKKNEKEEKPKKEEEVKKVVSTIKVNKKQKTVEELMAADNTLVEVDDSKTPVNIVFIGHVDAGKSTICGQMLLLNEKVDARTIQKYEKEAEENNRGTWWLAYIMDLNEEERAKGKTVEAGRAFFNTGSKRFTILDAPGHKSYVPNMISACCQADYGTLVISARKGEFETGFERAGQTREHALLSKGLGVNKLIVAINKMDDPSVKWSKARYDEIRTKLTPFLKSCGYNVERDVSWIPISGISGENMKERVTSETAQWYKGPCFMEILDDLPLPTKSDEGTVRIPVLDKAKDMGLCVFGKVEKGTVMKECVLTMMPSKINVEVQQLHNTEDYPVPYAKPGENVKMRLRGIEDEDIHRGHLLCSPNELCPIVRVFDVEMMVFELPDGKFIMTAGYKCVIHIHTALEECVVTDVLAEVERKTKKLKKIKLAKPGMYVRARISVNRPICAQTFKELAQLGRFALRDEEKTIAIGKIVKLKEGEGIN